MKLKQLKHIIKEFVQEMMDENVDADIADLQKLKKLANLPGVKEFAIKNYGSPNGYIKMLDGKIERLRKANPINDDPSIEELPHSGEPHAGEMDFDDSLPHSREPHAGEMGFPRSTRRKKI